VRTTSALRGKRVLILVENLSVPFDRRVWQESQALRRAGCEVVVICPQGKGYDVESEVVVDGVEIHRYRLGFGSGWMGYIREYLTALWRTWRLIRHVARRGRFDVIQACNPPDILLLAALPQRLRGTRFVFDHHDLVPELYLSRFDRGKDIGYRLTLLCERLTFALAEVVMSTNESYQQVALRRGKKSPEEVFVVRTAPDTALFRAVEPSESLKRGKPFLLAYVGVMGPQDGLDHALRALVHLHAQRQDWHAIFVGGGDVFEEMIAYARQLGHEDRVEFTGRVSNEKLLQVLSTADVCLSPDPLNPLNDVSTMNKILEYMACGKPVVSYDLVEARVSAGEAAAYARANDEADFAAQISALLDDPERRRRMGEFGRTRVETDLSWERSERELLRAYERAVRLPARATAPAAGHIEAQ
jgi:glycosyltransferase involved in cell wall biosynthesis